MNAEPFSISESPSRFGRVAILWHGDDGVAFRRVVLVLLFALGLSLVVPAVLRAAHLMPNS